MTIAKTGLNRYIEWAVILRGERKLVGDCGLTIQDVDGIEELEVGFH
jgi:hypothetical protein